MAGFTAFFRTSRDFLGHARIASLMAVMLFAFLGQSANAAGYLKIGDIKGESTESLVPGSSFTLIFETEELGEVQELRFEPDILTVRSFEQARDSLTVEVMLSPDASGGDTEITCLCTHLLADGSDDEATTTFLLPIAGNPELLGLRDASIRVNSPDEPLRIVIDGRNLGDEFVNEANIMARCNVGGIDQDCDTVDEDCDGISLSFSVNPPNGSWVGASSLQITANHPNIDQFVGAVKLDTSQLSQPGEFEFELTDVEGSLKVLPSGKPSPDQGEIILFGGLAGDGAGAAAGGGPHVKVFDGRTELQVSSFSLDADGDGAAVLKVTVRGWDPTEKKQVKSAEELGDEIELRVELELDGKRFSSSIGFPVEVVETEKKQLKAIVNPLKDGVSGDVTEDGFEWDNDTIEFDVLIGREFAAEGSEVSVEAFVSPELKDSMFSGMELEAEAGDVELDKRQLMSSVRCTFPPVDAGDGRNSNYRSIPITVVVGIGDAEARIPLDVPLTIGEQEPEAILIGLLLPAVQKVRAADTREFGFTIQFSGENLTEEFMEGVTVEDLVIDEREMTTGSDWDYRLSSGADGYTGHVTVLKLAAGGGGDTTDWWLETCGGERKPEFRATCVLVDANGDSRELETTVPIEWPAEMPSFSSLSVEMPEEIQFDENGQASFEATLTIEGENLTEESFSNPVITPFTDAQGMQLRWNNGVPMFPSTVTVRIVGTVSCAVDPGSFFGNGAMEGEVEFEWKVEEGESVVETNVGPVRWMAPESMKRSPSFSGAEFSSASPLSLDWSSEIIIKLSGENLDLLRRSGDTWLDNGGAVFLSSEMCSCVLQGFEEPVEGSCSISDLRVSTDGSSADLSIMCTARGPGKRLGKSTPILFEARLDCPGGPFDVECPLELSADLAEAMNKAELIDAMAKDVSVADLDGDGMLDIVLSCVVSGVNLDQISPNELDMRCEIDGAECEPSSATEMEPGDAEITLKRTFVFPHVLEISGRGSGSPTFDTTIFVQYTTTGQEVTTTTTVEVDPKELDKSSPKLAEAVCEGSIGDLDGDGLPDLVLTCVVTGENLQDLTSDDVDVEVSLEGSVITYTGLEFTSSSSDEIEISIFGFDPEEVRSAARTGRNPQTGKEIKIAARCVVGHNLGMEHDPVVSDFIIDYLDDDSDNDSIPDSDAFEISDFSMSRTEDGSLQGVVVIEWFEESLIDDLQSVVIMCTLPGGAVLQTALDQAALRSRPDEVSVMALDSNPMMKLVGSGWSGGPVDVEIIAEEIRSPRDAASGLPTGKRQHKPVSVTKPIDKATPLLMSVAAGDGSIAPGDQARLEMSFVLSGENLDLVKPVVTMQFNGEDDDCDGLADELTYGGGTVQIGLLLPAVQKVREAAARNGGSVPPATFTIDLQWPDGSSAAMGTAEINFVEVAGGGEYLDDDSDDDTVLDDFDGFFYENVEIQDAEWTAEGLLLSIMFDGQMCRMGDGSVMPVSDLTDEQLAVLCPDGSFMFGADGQIKDATFTGEGPAQVGQPIFQIFTCPADEPMRRLVSSDGFVECFLTQYSIISPRDAASGLPTGKRDAASGLPTGKRQHKPLTITKELDKSTPLLYQSLGFSSMDASGYEFDGEGFGGVCVVSDPFVVDADGNEKAVSSLTDEESSALFGDGSIPVFIEMEFPDGQVATGQGELISGDTSVSCVVGYIKIGDIKGESTDRSSSGEIEILSWSWGETNSGNRGNGGSSGMATGKRQHKPFTITKPVDKATPLLFSSSVGFNGFDASGLLFDGEGFEGVCVVSDPFILDADGEQLSLSSLSPEQSDALFGDGSVRVFVELDFPNGQTMTGEGELSSGDTACACPMNYMKFDGVDGESTDSSSSNEIEILSWSWGETRAGRDAASGMASGRRDAASGMATGKRQHKPVSFTKHIDKSTPLLAKVELSNGHVTVLKAASDGGNDGMCVVSFDFMCTGKELDKSSPKLMLTDPNTGLEYEAALEFSSFTPDEIQGKATVQVDRINFRQDFGQQQGTRNERSSGDGRTFDYFEAWPCQWSLTGSSSGDGSLPMESLSLNFSKIEFEYMTADDSSSSGPAVDFISFTGLELMSLERSGDGLSGQVRVFDPLVVYTDGSEEPFGSQHTGGANFLFADGSVRCFVEMQLPWGSMMTGEFEFDGSSTEIICPVATQEAQTDYFLKLPGVDGESTDSAKGGEIEILSWSWGETNVGRDAASGLATGKRDAASGLPTGKRQHKPISLSFEVGGGSPPQMFTGGVRVATGDLDGDGRADVITSLEASVEGSSLEGLRPEDLQVFVNFGNGEMEVPVQGFVVNSHTSAFDLSVFGFEPEPIATAAARKAGGQQEEYLTITLSDVLVSSFSTGGGSLANSSLTIPLEIDYRDDDDDGDMVPTDVDGFFFDSVEIQSTEFTADSLLLTVAFDNQMCRMGDGSVMPVSEVPQDVLDVLCPDGTCVFGADGQISGASFTGEDTVPVGQPVIRTFICPADDSFRTAASSGGFIECFLTQYSIISPRDAASGLPTGKRQHKPMTITKEIDKSTPLLHTVLVSNGNVTQEDENNLRFAASLALTGENLDSGRLQVFLVDPTDGSETEMDTQIDQISSGEGTVQIGLLLPAVQKVREAAARSRSREDVYVWKIRCAVVDPDGGTSIVEEPEVFKIIISSLSASSGQPSATGIRFGSIDLQDVSITDGTLSGNAVLSNPLIILDDGTEQAFGSGHSGGANFVFGDGSVRIFVEMELPGGQLMSGEGEFSPDMDALIVPVAMDKGLRFSDDQLGQEIEILAWSWGEIKSPRDSASGQATGKRDAASGQATGRRTFEPIVIRKRIDKSTPLLFEAARIGNGHVTVLKLADSGNDGMCVIEFDYSIVGKELDKSMPGGRMVITDPNTGEEYECVLEPAVQTDTEWSGHATVRVDKINFRQDFGQTQSNRNERSSGGGGRYNYFEAWPCKWISPQLNSSGNEVAMEELTIAHEGITYEGAAASSGDGTVPTENLSLNVEEIKWTYSMPDVRLLDDGSASISFRCVMDTELPQDYPLRFELELPDGSSVPARMDDMQITDGTTEILIGLLLPAVQKVREAASRGNGGTFVVCYTVDGGSWRRSGYDPLVLDLSGDGSVRGSGDKQGDPNANRYDFGVEKLSWVSPDGSTSAGDDWSSFKSSGGGTLAVDDWAQLKLMVSLVFDGEGWTDEMLEGAVIEFSSDSPGFASCSGKLTNLSSEGSAGATGQSRRRGDVTLGDIVVVKELDKSTPKLMLGGGLTVSGGSFRGSGDTGNLYEEVNIKPIRLELAITAPGGGSGAGDGTVPTEQLSLNFEEIKVTYGVQDFTDNGDGSGSLSISCVMDRSIPENSLLRFELELPDGSSLPATMDDMTITDGTTEILIGLLLPAVQKVREASVSGGGTYMVCYSVNDSGTWQRVHYDPLVIDLNGDGNRAQDHNSSRSNKTSSISPDGGDDGLELEIIDARLENWRDTDSDDHGDGVCDMVVEFEISSSRELDSSVVFSSSLLLPDGTSVPGVIEYQNGDDPVVRKRPGRVKYADITLKRGLITDGSLTCITSFSADYDGDDMETRSWITETVQGKPWKRQLTIKEITKDGGAGKFSSIDNAPEEKERGITINTSHVEYKYVNIRRTSDGAPQLVFGDLQIDVEEDWASTNGEGEVAYQMAFADGSVVDGVIEYQDGDDPVTRKRPGRGVQDNGDDPLLRKRPGRIKCGDVTLERGVAADSENGIIAILIGLLQDGSQVSTEVLIPLDEQTAAKWKEFSPAEEQLKGNPRHIVAPDGGGDTGGGNDGGIRMNVLPMAPDVNKTPAPPGPVPIPYPSIAGGNGGGGEGVSFMIEITGVGAGTEVDSAWETCSGGSLNIEISDSSTGSDQSHTTTPGHKYIDTLTLRGPLTSGRKAMMEWIKDTVGKGGSSSGELFVQLSDGTVLSCPLVLQITDTDSNGDGVPDYLDDDSDGDTVDDLVAIVPQTEGLYEFELMVVDNTGLSRLSAVFDPQDSSTATGGSNGGVWRTGNGGSSSSTEGGWRTVSGGGLRIHETESASRAIRSGKSFQDMKDQDIASLLSSSSGPFLVMDEGSAGDLRCFLGNDSSGNPAVMVCVGAADSGFEVIFNPKEYSLDKVASWDQKDGNTPGGQVAPSQTTVIVAGLSEGGDDSGSSESDGDYNSSRSNNINGLADNGGAGGSSGDGAGEDDGSIRTFTWKQLEGPYRGGVNVAVGDVNGVTTYFVPQPEDEELAEAIIARIRKRPDLLMQEWDELIDDAMSSVQNNPLYQEGSNTGESPLHEGMRGGGSDSGAGVSGNRRDGVVHRDIAARNILLLGADAYFVDSDGSGIDSLLGLPDGSALDKGHKNWTDLLSLNDDGQASTATDDVWVDGVIITADISLNAAGDDYGRHRLRFPLESGLAGHDGIWFFLPELDDEVVVSFLPGDPDQPIMIGRLYAEDAPKGSVPLTGGSMSVSSSFVLDGSRSTDDDGSVFLFAAIDPETLELAVLISNDSQLESSRFRTLSNASKARHEAAMGSVRNMK